jgi:hypothetical protein
MKEAKQIRNIFIQTNKQMNQLTNELFITFAP